MAVQIINEMPDAEVHRGDPLGSLLGELNARRARGARLNGRAVFMAVTIGLHALLAIALIRMQFAKNNLEQPAPIEAALLDAPAENELPPPVQVPPPMNIVYSLPTPQEITIETETISEMQGTAITSTAPVTTVAPLMEEVEYVRAKPPVFPKESQRRREYGTAILRILVDADGRPAQIQVERSSGYERLDAAAIKAAESFLFRPYEVNGVRQASQVRIPIGFDPPSRS
jgi:periplasmic protein TonB